MAEIWFYQLESQPLAKVLPELVSKGLARGLRMIVETGVVENVQRLSDLLWSYEDTAFIPHGFGDELSEQQRLWLCTDAANPNAATYRFYIDGAVPDSVEGLARAIIMIDSNSEDALANARNEWKKRKSEGHAVSYWKQDENGKWQNLA